MKRSTLAIVAATLISCASRTSQQPSTGVPVDPRPDPVAQSPDAATVEPADTGAPSSPDANTVARDDRDASANAVAAARPLYYEREITEQDLVGRSLRELAILRNTPYARMGHTFRRPWLDEYFRAQPWYQPRRVVQEQELSALDRRNARFVGTYDNALADARLDEMARALEARNRDGSLSDGDSVEAVLLSQRVGRQIVLTRASAPRRSTPLDDPSMLDEVLTRQQLSAMSIRDLWLLRNTIYARRGRPFRSNALLMYFDGVDWYQPDTAYNDARLRRVDRQNLRLIQSVEAESGGPTNARDEDEMMNGA